MVTVAVAGGTGGIGRAIVNELVHQAKHKVVILSRKASAFPGHDVPVIALDYQEPASMKKVLDEHKIEVVISALMLASDETSQSQLNLIEAAAQSESVNRFIPSEYGIDNTPELYSFYPSAKWWVDAQTLLRNSKLEYTRILIGYLMDTYGMPHFKSTMKPSTYVLDFENHRAAIPGDGNDPITMLHTIDIAKYVAALLDVNDWPETSAFVGERFTWNEAVRAAEKATGTKWDVTYDPINKLEKQEATVFEQPKDGYTEYPEEEMRMMFAAFGIFAVKGILDVSKDGTANERFPSITPIGMMEMIEKAWGGRKSA